MGKAVAADMNTIMSMGKAVAADMNTIMNMGKAVAAGMNTTMGMRTDAVAVMGIIIMRTDAAAVSMRKNTTMHIIMRSMGITTSMERVKRRNCFWDWRCFWVRCFGSIWDSRHWAGADLLLPMCFWATMC